MKNKKNPLRGAHGRFLGGGWYGLHRMKPHRAQRHGPLTPTRVRGVVWSPPPPLSSLTRGGGMGGRERRAVSPAASCGGVGPVVLALWVGGPPPAPCSVVLCVLPVAGGPHHVPPGGGRWEGRDRGLCRVCGALRRIKPSPPPRERDRGLSALDHKSCQSQQFSSMHFL